MASASEILFNFNQAKKRAQELEDTAAQLRKLANDELGQTLDNLAAAWKGEAATAYLNKGVRLKAKIIQSAKDLDSTATVIRNTAQRIYDAEMEAYRLAMERLYNK